MKRITKDNVTVKVNAVCYFRVLDPNKSVVAVQNFMLATSQISQTSLRSVVGEVSLDELLSERDKINNRLQKIIDQQTDPWGIKVSIVEIKDVQIPDNMQRAIAQQAEAERERRAGKRADRDRRRMAKCLTQIKNTPSDKLELLTSVMLQQFGGLLL